LVRFDGDKVSANDGQVMVVNRKDGRARFNSFCVADVALSTPLVNPLPLHVTRSISLMKATWSWGRVQSDQMTR